VWALTGDDETKSSSQKPNDNIDRIARLKQLLDSGAITESEFQSEKQNILKQ
jgi:hypothetical protein